MPIDDNSYYGTGSQAMPAMGGAPMYGDGQASLTDMRATYGQDMPGMLAYGAASGISIVGHGAYNGASRMMADLGGMIRPISYTPPARVYTGYSGRVQQQTGVMSDMKAMMSFIDAPRGTSPYLYSMNASADLGERAGLAAAGIGVTAATMAAASVTASIGSRMFGLPGGIAGSLGGYMAAGWAADKIYEGVAARQDTQSYLERTSNLYIGSGSKDADPRTGSGFSRGARKDVSEFVRSMDIGDKMLGGEDLQHILQKSTELGMFSGTNDVSDFKKKFKDIVSNVKLMTTTLNATLVEGLAVMKELKGIGISESMGGAVAQQAQALGKMSGRSAMEMVGIGLQGAELFRGTGVSMGIGFQANMMNVSAVRAARDANMISQEAISQAGGEEALAQRMTGSTLAYTQSAVGRGFGAMYAGPGGAFNQQAFGNTLTGNMDMGQAAMMAARNLSSPKAMIEYQVNQEKFRSEQGKMFGGKGLDIGMMNEVMMQASSISRWTGTDMDTSTKFIMKTQMGLSESEVTARMAQIKDPKKFFEAQQKATEAAMLQAVADASMQSKTLYRLGEKVDDVVKSVADSSGARAISNFVVDAGSALTNFNERDLKGIYRVDTSNIGLQAYAAGGGKQIVDRGKVDLSGSTWSTSPGNDLLDAIKKGVNNKSSIFYDMKIVTAYSGQGRNDKAPDVTLESTMIGDVKTGISSEDWERAKKASKGVISVEEAERLKESGALDKVMPGISKKYSELVLRGDIGRLSTLDQMEQSFFGDREDVSANERAGFMILAAKDPRMRAAFASRRDEALKVTGATAQRYVIEQENSIDIINKNYEALGLSSIKDGGLKQKLAAAMLAPDKATQEKLLQEIASDPATAGEAGAVSQAISEVRNPRGGNPDRIAAAKSVQEQTGIMYDRQVTRGTAALEAGVRGLLDAKGGTLSDKEKTRITSYVSLLSNAEDTRTLLSDGKRVAELKETISKVDPQTRGLLPDIERLEGLKKIETIADPKAAMAALTQGGLSTDKAKEIIDYRTKAGSNEAAMEQARTSVATSAAGNQVATASGAGSALEVMVQQVNINQVTLAAMQQLANKLGVK